ncbi:lipopolysaccharide biosynthesis protein, partial [Candidatus Neomarinimicrobiota bacterium]
LLVSGLIMVIVLLVSKAILPDYFSSMFQLIVLIPLGCAVYFLAMWQLDRPLLLEVWGLARSKS